MKGLPYDVKNQFYEITATLCPDYNAILSKVDNVIEKLNKIGLNTKDSTIKPNPNNSNSNASKAQSINFLTNQPTNSPTGYKGNRKWKSKNCRFCQSSDHSSTKCSTYLTPESRIAALRNRQGSEICHKCTQKHSGKCRDRFRGCCVFKKSCKSNPHQFSICPIKCKALATKLSKTSVVETVAELPGSESGVSRVESPSLDPSVNTPETIGGVYVNGKKRRSVALETLTLTVFNDSCSSIPIHEKGVGA